MKKHPEKKTICYAPMRGQEYHVAEQAGLTKARGIRGVCSDPSGYSREILIDSALPATERLEVLIHEMLHACFWDMKEEAVRDAGQSMARLLWHVGYRQTKTPADDSE